MPDTLVGIGDTVDALLISRSYLLWRFDLIALIVAHFEFDHVESILGVA
jgi:hypothetical protein